jgi:general secretion pathway protein G
MIARNTRRALRRAFTLMEMLVVVAIIVILAGGGTFYYLKYLDEAKVNKAKMQVKALETAVEAYYVKHQEYPQSLLVLTQREADGSKAAMDADALKTPWGAQYNYDPNGGRNGGNKPDIWADSPQGPIGNWPGQGK